METKRSFMTGKKEHKQDLTAQSLTKLDNQNLTKIAAVEEHVVTCDHLVNWLERKISGFENDCNKRCFLEPFFINKNSNDVNEKKND